MSYFSQIKINPQQFSVDAFGRNRVSQISTLFDGKVLNSTTNILFDITGSGTIVSGSSKIDLSVGANKYVVLESKTNAPYFSGKGQLIETTFDTFAPDSNVVKRIGYFTATGSVADEFDGNIDGAFIMSSGSNIHFQMWRSGTLVENKPLEQWSGYSNLSQYKNVDTWDNFTVAAHCMAWLGGYQYQLWIKTSNGMTLAHLYEHAGNATDVMMTFPCHPIRYEIRSDGGTGNVRYICSQIATEGSIDKNGVIRCVDTGATGISCASVGVVYPILAIRKDREHDSIPILLSNISAFTNSNTDQARWSVVVNPTLSAPLTYNALANSAAQYATGSGAITATGGTVIASGYISQNQIQVGQVLDENFLSYLGSKIDKTSDEYVLCMTPITTTVVCFGSMAIKEL